MTSLPIAALFGASFIASVWALATCRRPLSDEIYDRLAGLKLLQGERQ